MILFIVAGVLIGLMVLLSGCGGNGNNGGNGGTSIDWKFMLGVSPNYTLIGAPDYVQYFDLMKKYHCNALRVFCFSGWGDMATSYVYKAWNGTDVGSIDQNIINRIRDFCGKAKDRGIIVILDLFHRNGDPFAYACTAPGLRQREYMRAIVNATKDLGSVVYEPLNEDPDQNFCEFVQNEIRLVYPEAKTCFYECHGGTYRIIHTTSKNYVGGGVIQSNDKSNYTNILNAGDYFNIAKVAKEKNGHVEYLLYWNKDKPPNNNPAEMESNYQDTLNLIKQVRA